MDMLDSALNLKKAFDKGDAPSIEEAVKMLQESELVNKLLVDPKQKPHTFVGLRALEWRLLELSEIPYTIHLDKVQEWVQLLVSKSFIKEGFSLTGKRDGMLACHNAMITSLLIKLGYEKKEMIDAGIKWILDYQSVERTEQSTWSGKDLYKRFGGCMKATPCFHGVVKSMVALTEYKKRYASSEQLDHKLNRGLEYILDHRLYHRLSDHSPIDSSMILNFYPYTYKTNIIEMLTLLKDNGLDGDERCKEAIDILKNKRRSDGSWQADVSYMKNAWVEFDPPKKTGPWITYKIETLVESF